NDAEEEGGVYRNSSAVKLTDTTVCGNSPNDQIEGKRQDLGGNCVEINCDDCQTAGIADVNQDGIVDSADLGLVVAAWGSQNEQCDLDGSGTVDGGDIAYVLGYWDSCVSE
ncbi:MAG: dockerin type I domain-containing protein, partial [Planctomycetota bacterium]|nr:dockerin type I domain-containing protein [Planctomycetota bacterium]